MGDAGQITTRPHPEQIDGFDWTQASGGAEHTLAHPPADGTLWGWGYNGWSSLGDGTFTWRIRPTKIGTDRWLAVSAGDEFSLGIRSDGSLLVWGRNDVGQVGDGTTDCRNGPVIVATGTWKAIARGGSARCRHQIRRLALGHGASTPTARRWHHDHPVPADADRDGHYLGVGGTPAMCTYAVRTDGSLWAWGDNSFAHLGDGTITDRLAPVRLGTATTWSRRRQATTTRSPSGPTERSGPGVRTGWASSATEPRSMR